MNMNTNIRKSTHDVIIGYDHYTVEQALSKILPQTLLDEIPSSFEVVGSIAHLNLRDEYLPFKYIIGRVILDKNKSIQVCVNKTGTIQNEFRTFPMEIIADDRKSKSSNSTNSLPANKNDGEKRKRQSKVKMGDGNGNFDGNNDASGSGSGALLQVDVKEDGCKFRLDFEKVYWNSRLQHEHRRIVHLIGSKKRPTNAKQRQHQHQSSKKGYSNNGDSTNGKSQQEGIKQSPRTINSDGNTQTKTHKDTKHPNAEKIREVVVADACAGIGPFAIPLTSQYSHIKVYANDLNPISYKYLNINSKINKCQKLHTYNMDARYFIQKLDNDGITYHHVLMNLPAIAPEFLNVFQGWRGKGKEEPRPFIHVHCFGGKGEGAADEAMTRCSQSLGCLLDKVRDEVTVHIVRDVSPKKNMLCVSFRLPEGVQDLQRISVFGPVTTENGNEEVDDKMCKEEPDTKRVCTSTSS